MYRLVVWGTGAVYNRHVNLLKYFELKQEIQVVAVISGDILPVSKIDGYTVMEPESIRQMVFDYLMIMSDLSFADIMEHAISAGTDRKQILSYKILDIPGLVFEQYIRLKESSISIISNNCWGGTVYSTLGMECLSPFKNLFLEDEDYIRMLENFTYYLDCNPEYGGTATDIHSRKEYPVLMLDDVKVHCNHEEDYDSAVQKWNRRRKKVNINNLFLEMYTDRMDIASAFSRLGIGRNKICFVPFKSDNPVLFQLGLGAGQTELWEAVNSNAGIGRNSSAYHIVDLLNGKECRRCE